MINFLLKTPPSEWNSSLNEWTNEWMNGATNGPITAHQPPPFPCGVNYPPRGWRPQFRLKKKRHKRCSHYWWTFYQRVVLLYKKKLIKKFDVCIDWNVIDFCWSTKKWNLAGKIRALMAHSSPTWKKNGIIFQFRNHFRSTFHENKWMAPSIAKRFLCLLRYRVWRRRRLWLVGRKRHRRFWLVGRNQRRRRRRRRLWLVAVLGPGVVDDDVGRRRVDVDQRRARLELFAIVFANIFLNNVEIFMIIRINCLKWLE